jgi:hypothetical protein
MQTNLKFEKFFRLTKLGFRNIIHPNRTALSKLHVDTSAIAIQYSIYFSGFFRAVWTRNTVDSLEKNCLNKLLPCREMIWAFVDMHVYCIGLNKVRCWFYMLLL